MSFWKHLKTVNTHRWLVCKGCFELGLYWQGLTHDLSKYSPDEFITGIRFYQGTRSPNAAEREIKGYSESWMHHKGRNRHHYEYWTDMDFVEKRYVSFPMPRKYLAEMVVDRIAACITYQGKDYTDASASKYFSTSLERLNMHPKTKRELEYILDMLSEKGRKETFRYLKHHVLKGKPFPWEENE